jgi:predicted aminopeptidase
MRRLAVVTLAVALGGCLMPRYLGQAATGQLELLTRGRPISKVIDDPDVPIAIRELLAEVPSIKAFAGKKGLTITRNYTKYVDLGRDYVVFFVGAAPRLSFEARTWCFPIAGCFTGLGWFDEQDAVEFRDELEADGWDSFARPASAYSTGGWFPDPLLSSMLPDGDPRTPDEATGFADLANVFLHESVHATIFVPDQPHFNEGIAEYIGDRLADELLVERFGEGAAEVLAYRDELAWRAGRVRREMEAYDQLKVVYESKAPDAEKLEQKAAIIDALVDDLGLRRRPNNASLVEVRVYLASYEGFAEVHAACGSTERLIEAGKTIRRGDFEKDVQDDLAPVLAKMKAACGTKKKSSEKVARGSSL